MHPQGILFGLQILNNNHDNKHTVNKTNRTKSYDLCNIKHETLLLSLGA